MEKTMKKTPVIVNTIIMMLILLVQAIVKFYYIREVEFLLLRFMSIYFICCYSVYLYSFCKDLLFILDTFCGFIRFQLIYLFIFMIAFCITFHTSDIINDFIIDYNKPTIPIFRGMTPFAAYSKSNIILYGVELIQMFYFLYTVYFYIITKRYIDELKKEELKQLEEARAIEEGIIAAGLEEDENRTVINVDDNVQDGDGQDEITVINDDNSFLEGLEDLDSIIGNANTPMESNTNVVSRSE